MPEKGIKERNKDKNCPVCGGGGGGVGVEVGMRVGDNQICIR